MSPDEAYARELAALAAQAGRLPFETLAERYTALIGREPQRAAAYQSLALFCAMQGQLAVAHYVIDEALRLDDGRARSHQLKARLCDEALDTAAAVAHYRQALALSPGERGWRLQLGLAEMALGDFAAGTLNYRSRLDEADCAAVAGCPAWRPGQGGRVLVWAEQGLGDELMFGRLLPLLHAEPARFTVQADARLLGLLRAAHPGLDWVPRGDTAVLRAACAGHDAQLPLGDLLLHFHHRLADPALQAARLPAPPRPALQALRRADAAQGRRWIGLSWLSMNADFGPMRSVDVGALAAATDPDRDVLVNLQYLAPPAQLQALRARGHAVVDAVDPHQDIEGLAALMACCDTVLSIDNSTLHLAGALGVPAHGLVPRLPNWRWGLDREDTVWYPTVRLLRQAAAGDWSAPLARWQAALRSAPGAARPS